MNDPAGGPAAGWDCHVHVFEAATVRGAHYQPVARPLEAIEALAQAHGCGHLVLVQPSVYGTDNGLLLRALQRSLGRHRGVVVVHGEESPGTLDAMHAAGVRGVRFNLVSPVGSARTAVPAQLRQWAPALRARGWHVQWYLAPQDLHEVAALQQECGLVFVLDHLAGLTARTDDPQAWSGLETLAKGGAWIKLSGWYRLQAQAPYEDLLPVIRRVATLFGDRMVWASDWPHTSFAPDALPEYESVWDPVPRALGTAHAQAILLAGARLYA